jgi:hypothetical protein
VFEKIKIARKERVHFSEESESGLLCHPETGAVEILNETGVFIWKRLDGETSKEDILRALKEEFSIEDTQKAAQEYDTYITKLQGMKLLQTQGIPPPFPQNICFGITSRCNFSCKHWSGYGYRADFQHHRPDG